MYVTFTKKEFFGTKDDSSCIAGFYNVNTGEPQKWYGMTSEYVQEPPHYMVYDVENGTILKEDLQDVKMSDDDYVLIKGQDTKWQYADVTTFQEISNQYDAAALFQGDMAIVLQSEHPAIIDRDFHVLYTDEQIIAEDVISMGYGFYKIKIADGWKLLRISVETIE